MRSSWILRSVEWQFLADVLGQLLGPICKGQEWTSWSFKMGPLDCPETSVRNCHSKLHNNPEERISHLHRGGSLKSRKFRNIQTLLFKFFISNCSFNIAVPNSDYISSECGNPLISNWKRPWTDFRQTCYTCPAITWKDRENSKRNLKQYFSKWHIPVVQVILYVYYFNTLSWINAFSTHRQ